MLATTAIGTTLALSTYLAIQKFANDRRSDTELELGTFANIVHDYSSHSIIGRRPYQEDRLVLEVLPGDRFFVAAIMDGHGSNQCSEYLKQNLVESLQSELSGSMPGDLSQPIYKACMKLHKDLIDPSKNHNDFSGSTLTGLVLDRTQACKCWVFNLGDSQTIMYGLKSHQLVETRKHDLSAERITQLRRRNPHAIVGNDGNGTLRLMGHDTGLNLSGAYGNNHDSELAQSLIREVEVSQYAIEEPTQFVLASDGLFDDVNPSKVAKLIVDHGMDAKQLCNYVLQHGPKGDNVTCIVFKCGLQN